jgi:hypothetical protein
LHYYRNCERAANFTELRMPRPNSNTPLFPSSPLAWPAGMRVLAVLPVVTLLWLGVWWANAQVAL